MIIVQQFTKNKVQSSIAFGTLWSVLFMIQSQLHTTNCKYNMYKLREVWWIKVTSWKRVKFFPGNEDKLEKECLQIVLPEINK